MNARIFYCLISAVTCAWWIFAHIWFMIPFSVAMFLLWWKEDD